MSVIRSPRTLIAAGALGLGLLGVPALASAAPSTHHTAVIHVTSAPTTTAPKKTTATTTPKPATTPSTKTYTVVAGTFRTQAQADKRVAAITAKGINGLSVVQIGKTAKSTRFRVEETGLARTDAKTLWKQLRKAHFFAYFTAR
jgi:cell division protein FtsN